VGFKTDSTSVARGRSMGLEPKWTMMMMSDDEATQLNNDLSLMATRRGIVPLTFVIDYR